MELVYAEFELGTWCSVCDHLQVVSLHSATQNPFSVESAVIVKHCSG